MADICIDKKVGSGDVFEDVEYPRKLAVAE